MRLLKLWFFLFLLTLANLGCTLDASVQQTLKTSLSSTVTADKWGVNGIDKFSVADKANMSPSLVRTRPDGKILVWQNTSPQAYRLNSDGSLDTSFGTAGFLSLTVPAQIQDIALTNDAMYLGYGGNDVGGLYVQKRFADGTLDSSFGTNGTATADSTFGYLKKVVVQPDGKVLVAGYLLFSPNYRVRIVRLNTDGSLDSSFGTAGVVTISDTTSVFLATIDLQSDGSIWVATSTSWSSSGKYFVRKLLANGTVDTSSGFATATGGVASFSPGAYFRVDVHAAKPLSSGKIAVIGAVTPCNGCQTQGAIALLKADGSLDTTFGSSGIKAIDFGSSRSIYDIVEVTGGIRLFAQNSSGLPRVGQVTSTGALDTSYGTSGFAEVPVSTTGFSATGYNYDGSSVYWFGIVPQGTPAFNYSLVSRSDVNLATDTGFAQSGISLQINGISYGHVNDSHPLADGKTLILGGIPTSAKNSDFITRLNVDGSIDTSFGQNGFVFDTFGANALRIRVTSDNKIILAGQVGSDSLTLARLSYDGVLDTSFGTAGKRSYSFAGLPSWSWAWDFQISPAGKMVFTYGYNTIPNVVRLLANGDPDPSFGTNGVQSGLSMSASYSYGGMFTVIQPDDKIVIAGWASQSSPWWPKFFVLRLDGAGNLDSTFAGGSGYTVIDLGSDSDSTPQGLALDSLGNIYVLVNAPLPPNYVNEATLVSFAADGTLRAGFGTSGILRTGSSFYVDTNAWMMPALIVDSQDRIYALGTNSSSDIIVQSWLSDGTSNTALGTNGVMSANFAPDTTYRAFTNFYMDGNENFKVVFYDTGLSGVVRFKTSAGAVQ